MKRADIVRLAVAGFFLIACFMTAVPTARTFALTFGKKSKSSVSSRLASARKAISTKFPERLSLVSLNGFFVRLVGQHQCNGVVKTGTQGSLFMPKPDVANVENASRRMKRFADLCAENGAKFLYVQSPYNIDMSNRMLPPGVIDRSHENVLSFLALLRAGNVDHVDLRPEFCARPEDAADNFYRTDHHWNNDAAFRAAGLLVKEIASRTGVPEEDVRKAGKLLSPESWERIIHEECFLGSLGRRTGPIFSGLDDLIVLRPRFETGMSLRIPSKDAFLKGTFEETNMHRAEEALADAESFTTDAYSALYVGGIYPHTIHKNPGAPLRKRVLIIGDSLVRPVEAFLSVAIEHLEVVDLRRTKKSFSMARYVRRMKPDIVIQMLGPNSLRADAIKGPKTGQAVMFDYGFRRRKRNIAPTAGSQ